MLKYYMPVMDEPPVCQTQNETGLECVTETIWNLVDKTSHEPSGAVEQNGDHLGECKPDYLSTETRALCLA